MTGVSIADMKRRSLLSMRYELTRELTWDHSASSVKISSAPTKKSESGDFIVITVSE